MHRIWSQRVEVGGALMDTSRTSTRRDFLFDAPPTFEPAVGLFRPDLLLQPSVIDFYHIGVIEGDESTPSFLAELARRGVKAATFEGAIL